MIDAIIDLIRDGNDQPQNFRLRIRYANQGENPPIVSVFGTEAHLRAVLIDVGRAEVEINTLFENVGGKRKRGPGDKSRAFTFERAAYDEQPFLQGNLPACLASKCDPYLILLRLGILRSHLQPALWKHSAVALEKNGP